MLEEVCIINYKNHMQLQNDRCEIMNASNYQSFIHSLFCANLIIHVLHCVDANHSFVKRIITCNTFRYIDVIF